MQLHESSLGRFGVAAPGTREQSALQVELRPLALAGLQMALGEGQVHLTEAFAERVGGLLQLGWVVLELREQQRRLLAFGQVKGYPEDCKEVPENIWLFCSRCKGVQRWSREVLSRISRGPGLSQRIEHRVGYADVTVV